MEHINLGGKYEAKKIRISIALSHKAYKQIYLSIKLLSSNIIESSETDSPLMSNFCLANFQQANSVVVDTLTSLKGNS